MIRGGRFPERLPPAKVGVFEVNEDGDFGDGAVFGSREFVDGIFSRHRDRFGPKREIGRGGCEGLRRICLLCEICGWMCLGEGLRALCGYARKALGVHCGARGTRGRGSDRGGIWFWLGFAFGSVVDVVQGMTHPFGVGA